MEKQSASAASLQAGTGDRGSANRSVVRLIVPRQHGAWSVLLSGFVVGAASGRLGAEAAILLGIVVLGFFARHAAAVCWRLPAGDNRRGPVLGWALTSGFSCAVLGVVLAVRYQRWLLVPLGMLAGGFAAASLVLERRRRERTMLGELAGMLGLSLVVPAAAYAGGGGLDPRTIGLWALSALFFCGGVSHVRYVVRTRRERAESLAARVRAGWASLAYHAGALAAAFGLAAARAAPGLAPLVLVPAAARAIWTVLRPYDGPIRIRRIGYAEVFYLLIFMVLTISVFRACALSR